jgi:hypothetical protein
MVDVTHELRWDYSYSAVITWRREDIKMNIMEIAFGCLDWTYLLRIDTVG